MIPGPHLERGSFGRVRRNDLAPHPGNADYPLARGLEPRGAIRRLVARVSPRLAGVAPIPEHRLWTLYKRDQIDQEQTPMCVGATSLHWERSLPIRCCPTEPAEQAGFARLAWLYQQMKAVDGYPDLDGTDGHAAFTVLRALGEIESYFWYDGQDKQAPRDWVRSKSGLFLGVYVSEEMAMSVPGADGRWPVVGRCELGHEMLVRGYDPSRKGREWAIQQSWGLGWGPLRGLFYWSESEFWDRVEDAGDLGGAWEKVA
jgi:hypothetical protein